jgi:NADH-quinone oxidoreductase subunit L
MHVLHYFLKPGFGPAEAWISNPHHFNMHELFLISIAVAAAGVSIYIAYMIYRKNNFLPVDSEEDMTAPQRVIYNKYYVDELYDAIIRKPFDKLSDLAYRFFEIPVVDGIVNGVGNAAKQIGGIVKYAQSGSIGLYLFSMIVAIILFIVVKLY